MTIHPNLSYYEFMKIRPIEARDFPQWLILWEGYNSFYQRSVQREVTEKTWERLLDPNEPVLASVAEVDGKVLGFTICLFHRHTALTSDVCYLQDLFVEEKVRGQGIGKELILSVYEYAKEREVPQVYWMTHENNRVARSLYDQLAKYSGFIVYSNRI